MDAMVYFDAMDTKGTILGSGSKGLVAGSDFANLQDLRNHIHSFDPIPYINKTVTRQVFIISKS
jgi:hypothetical protein